MAGSSRGVSRRTRSAGAVAGKSRRALLSKAPTTSDPSPVMVVTARTLPGDDRNPSNPHGSWDSDADADDDLRKDGGYGLAKQACVVNREYVQILDGGLRRMQVRCPPSWTGSTTPQPP